jgi:tetratricopeptide (TPR) repeat protein
LKHDDFYKNGIYWCLREGSEINEDLRKLLWKERAYFVIVDGFDEVLAEINSIIPGGSLPIDTSFISDKSNTIIDSFLSNDILINSKSKVINGDMRRLESERKKDKVFSLVKKINTKNDDGDVGNKYDDEELMKLLKVEDFMQSKQYKSVIDYVKEIMPGSRKGVKVRLLSAMYKAYVELELNKKAMSVCDDLLEIEPFNSVYYINKARVVEDVKEKIRLLDEGIEKEPYFSGVYYEKAKVLMRVIAEAYGKDKDRYLAELECTLNTCVMRGPGVSNRCWSLKFDFVKKYGGSLSDKKRKQNEILEKLSNQDANSPVVFRMRADLLDYDGDDVGGIDKLIRDIDAAISRTESDDKGPELNVIKCEILLNSARYDELDDLVSNLDELEVMSDNQSYDDFKVDMFVKGYGDLKSAEPILLKSVTEKRNSHHVGELVNVYLYMDEPDKAKDILVEHGCLLTGFGKSKYWTDYYDSVGDYEQALKCLNESSRISGIDGYEIAQKVYFYIKKGDSKEGEKVARGYLESIDFDSRAAVLIINYELARKNNGKKIDKARLDKLISLTDSPSVKAAGYALIGDIDECLSKVEGIFKKDSSAIYLFRKWPVFDSIRDNPKYLSLVAQTEWNKKTN